MRRPPEGWPEPRPDFLAALAEELRPARRRPSPGRRAAFAAAVSFALLAAFAAAGGVGHAGNGLGHAASAVGDMFEPGAGPSAHGHGSRGNSAHDQYQEECERQVRLAIAAEEQQHDQAVAAEDALHAQLMAEALLTPGKDDDRAERHRHHDAVKAERSRHHEELKRLKHEFRDCKKHEE